LGGLLVSCPGNKLNNNGTDFKSNVILAKARIQVT
jgi:hypothetical protein